MKEVFDDTKELKKRYGLKTADSTDVQSGPSAQISDTTSTTAFAATFQRFQARILKTQKSAGIVSKTRWAICDGDKFIALIQKLHGWNDDLDNILKALERTAVQERIVKHEFHLMENIDDIHTIEEVAAEDNPSISDAASFRLGALRKPAALKDAYSGRSLSNESFWTAPSQNLDSIKDQMQSLDLANLAATSADMIQQRFQSRSSDRQGFQAQQLDNINNGQSLRQTKYQEEFSHFSLDSDMNALDSAPPLGEFARNRVLRELRQIEAPEFVCIELISDKINEILGCIKGPVGTSFEGGNFFIHILIPPTYPMRSLLCVIITKIYHPNVNSQGKICADIFDNNWIPAITIVGALLSIHLILSNPNVKDPLVREIAAQYLKDRDIYESNVKRYTQVYASQERPSNAEIELARQRNERELMTAANQRIVNKNARNEHGGTLINLLRAKIKKVQQKRGEEQMNNIDGNLEKIWDEREEQRMNNLVDEYERALQRRDKGEMEDLKDTGHLSYMRYKIVKALQN